MIMIDNSGQHSSQEEPLVPSSSSFLIHYFGMKLKFQRNSFGLSWLEITQWRLKESRSMDLDLDLELDSPDRCFLQSRGPGHTVSAWWTSSSLWSYWSRRKPGHNFVLENVFFNLKMFMFCQPLCIKSVFPVLVFIQFLERKFSDSVDRFKLNMRMLWKYQISNIFRRWAWLKSKWDLFDL